MRSFVPRYELVMPQNLGDALALIAREPGKWKPFAGGTDLMVLFEAGKLSHTTFCNISDLPELKGIRVLPNSVEIGALTTYTDIAQHAEIQREFSLLCQAALVTGAVAIQNRGTIGGNIVNASPAADTPPALLAYDAQAVLVSARGERTVAYAHFHQSYKEMDIRPDELLKTIVLPRRPGTFHQYYRKVGTRKAQAISKVCLAAVARMEKKILAEIRIGIASVAPVPFRVRRTETFLIGKTLSPIVIAEAKTIVGQEISPIDDIRSTAAYRRRVTENLLEEFLCGIGSPNSKS